MISERVKIKLYKVLVKGKALVAVQTVQSSFEEAVDHCDDQKSPRAEPTEHGHTQEGEGREMVSEPKLSYVHTLWLEQKMSIGNLDARQTELKTAAFIEICQETTGAGRP